MRVWLPIATAILSVILTAVAFVRNADLEQLHSADQVESMQLRMEIQERRMLSDQVARFREEQVRNTQRIEELERLVKPRN